MSNSEFWEKVKGQLSLYTIAPNNLSRLKLFIKSAKILISGADLFILVPNTIIKGIIEKEFISYIKQAIYDVCKKNYSVKIEIQSKFSLTQRPNIESVKENTCLKNLNVGDLSNKDVEQKTEEKKDILPISLLPPDLLKKNTVLLSSDSNSDFSNNNLNKKFDEPVTSPNYVGCFLELSNDEIKNNPFYRDNTIQKNKNFNNFVEGPTNQYLCHNGKLVAENPGKSDRNPFFVYGDSGLGKTHILYAIGNEVMRIFPNKKVMYVTLDQFYQNFVAACSDFKNNTSSYEDSLANQFKLLYRSLDVLLIDDMQELERYKGIGNEFITLMNDIAGSSMQIVFAASCHPNDLRKVDSKLRNRFISGVSIKVEPPDLETRKKIIHEKTRELGLIFDKKSIDFVASKFQTNVREIEGHIKTIAAKKAFLNDGNHVTIDVVKTALKDVLASHAKLITVDNIKQTVADYYKISVKDIDSSARPANIAHARMMAMKLARELTNQSFPSLGKEFGGKDHSTVMNANKKISQLIKSDEHIKDDYEFLKMQLV